MDALIDPIFQEFVRANEDADVARLLLGRLPPGIDGRAAAEQIRARQKTRAKLPAWHAAAGIVFPPPHSVEQASSSATAAYKAALVATPRVVDLTGGMGVDALAFAARGCAVTYVEPDPELCRRFAHNARALALADEHMPGDRLPRVVNADARAFLATLRDDPGYAPVATTFYLDPARRDAVGRRVAGFEDCSPNLLDLLPRLGELGSPVMVKAAPMLDIAAALRALDEVRAGPSAHAAMAAPAVREVHVVSVANECKELLVLLDGGCAGEPEIVCVDLPDPDGRRSLRFRASAETGSAGVCGPPGRYLYDPHAAIRKAGAFRVLGDSLGLARLAPNTHLYTSDERVADFPGRVFETLRALDGKARRQLRGVQANVVVRNHPESAEHLRARLGIRDGGSDFVIGFRDLEGRARLVLARRLDA